MYELVCGDAINVLKSRDNADTRRIDLTVTSPPYCLDMPYANSDDGMPYPQYLDWTFRWLMDLWYVTANGGRLCLNIPLDTNRGGERAVYADILAQARLAGWQYKSTIVWNENNISSRTAWGSWRSATAPNLICPVEMILVLYKGSQWKRDRPEGLPQEHIERNLFMQSTLALWTFNGEKKKRFGHPAPFPEELPRRCIEMFSFPGDLVCDPFLGSGTTGAVCEKRDFLGIDISPEYVEIAAQRIQDLYPDANFAMRSYVA